ncbi:hypothetical protein N7535_002790 [Penicillium sp. DV-2018c]|nr:hypothetical protein N7535_002790 [Penicillium sp. DV-2018c]
MAKGLSLFDMGFKTSTNTHASGWIPHERLFRHRARKQACHAAESGPCGISMCCDSDGTLTVASVDSDPHT